MQVGQLAPGQLDLILPPNGKRPPAHGDWAGGRSFCPPRGEGRGLMIKACECGKQAGQSGKCRGCYKLTWQRRRRVIAEWEARCGPAADPAYWRATMRDPDDPALLPDDGFIDPVAVAVAVAGTRDIRMTSPERELAGARIVLAGGDADTLLIHLCLPTPEAATAMHARLVRGHRGRAA